MTTVTNTETLEETAKRIAGFSLVAYHDNPDAVRAQLKAAVLSALRNERERAAKIADEHESTHGNIHFGRCGAAIAAAIRSQPYMTKDIANSIVDELFRNHFGEQATRLEMKQDDGQGGERDLGGWCRESVIEIIDKHLPVTLKRIRTVKAIREGR